MKLEILSNLYKIDEAKSATLLERSKLDYNLVQSVYQTELKELARWLYFSLGCVVFALLPT